MIDLVVREKSVTEPGGGRRVLFEGLHLEIDGRATSVALLGRSGSGKTTLLRILAGLDVSYEGSYTYRGRVLRPHLDHMAAFRRSQVGYVMQDQLLLRDRSAVDNVLLGLPGRSRDAARARRCLAEVGLEDKGGQSAATLSGGEAQRVVIARMLYRRPPLVLADEPTGALDEETEGQVLGLLSDLRAQGTTLVVATHSPVVAAACDRRLRLVRGALVEA